MDKILHHYCAVYGFNCDCHNLLRRVCKVRDLCGADGPDPMLKEGTPPLPPGCAEGEPNRNEGADPVFKAWPN